MITLTADSEPQLLAIVSPRLSKGSHTSLTLPPPILARFVAGPENAPLVELLRPDSIAELVDRSPIVLIGANSTGKTTMAATLLALWSQDDPSRRLMLTSAVEFSRALSRAIKADDMQRFRQLHRECDGLLLDNLHEFVGKPAAQEELLSTLDQLSLSGKCFVATATDLPLATPGLSRSLQSRLSAGLCVAMHPPAKHARKRLIEELALDASLGIPQESLLPLFETLEVDPTAVELKGAILRWSHQLRLNPNAALRSARSVEGILDTVAARAIEPQEIAKVVCKEANVTMEQLKGPSRKSSIVRARGLAMLLIRQLTAESYENIGAIFSHRDHSTVMHACKKTEVDLSVDTDLNRMHDRIRSRFRRFR